MIKIHRHRHAAVTLSHSGFWLVMGLLLMRVCWFIRLCNSTQSGNGGWCVRLPQGHPSTGWEPSRTSLVCLSLVYILILFPAWPLRKSQDAIKNQPMKLVWILTGLKTARTCAKGEGGFPPEPPSTPLIVSFPSKRSVMDWTLMENDCWEKNAPPLLKTKQHSSLNLQLYIAVITRQESFQPTLVSASLRTKQHWPKTQQLPASPSLFLPPVFVRLVLLASVGVSRGLLRESGGSDSICGCWLWWWGFEKIPFCCTAPPAIIFRLALYACAAFAFKPPFPVFYAARTVQMSPLWRRERPRIRKYACFLRTGEVSSAFLRGAPCGQRCCTGTKSETERQLIGSERGWGEIRNLCWGIWSSQLQTR